MECRRPDPLGRIPKLSHLLKSSEEDLENLSVMNKALAVNLVEQPEIIELLTRRRTSTSRPHRGPPAYLRLALGAAAFAVALHFNLSLIHI